MMRMRGILAVLLLLLISSSRDAVVAAQDPENFGSAVIFGNCTIPCLLQTEFCGTDDQCHEWNCFSWYEYGPTDFTLYDASVPLNCVDVNYVAPVLPPGPPNAVTYGCIGYPNMEPPSNGTALTMGFNRQCTADMGLARLECHDMGGQDLPFPQFVDAVKEGGISCEDPSKSPKYIYHATYEYSYSQLGFPGDEDYRPPQGLPVFDAPGSSGDIFNSTIAVFTMYARLEVERTYAPSASPSASPSTSMSPTISQTSGIVRIYYPGSTAVLAPLSLLLLFS